MNAHRHLPAALLAEPADGGRARCACCLRRCLIAPGQRGACGTREQRDGRLVSLIADRVSSACVDPIEKKPLYHWYPGSRVFSLGTVGCSFTCPGCQNGQLARHRPREADPALRQVTPEAAVRLAVASGAEGICWTYNDPAIWLDFTLPAARLARARGLYTVYVTNGSATRAHLDLIGPYLDAYRVDLKAWSPARYRAIAGFAEVGDLLDSVRYARERWGMHVECVTNVTPTMNEQDEELAGMAGWIAEALGRDTPWHLTRFHPCEEFAHLPATPLSTLDRAAAIGRAAGLRYLYVGNVPGDPRQHTICPGCGRVVIRRQGFTVRALEVRQGACAHCRTAIAGRWRT